jgi:preprotein translocase subunit SecA
VQVTVDGQNGAGVGEAGAGGALNPAFAASGSSTRAGRVSYSGGSSAMGAGALAAAAAAAGPNGAAYDGEGEAAEALPVVEQRVTDSEHELGRNDPCWCGSGKKFKRCHGA